jgi:hypothetical protein
LVLFGFSISVFLVIIIRIPFDQIFTPADATTATTTTATSSSKGSYT